MLAVIDPSSMMKKPVTPASAKPVRPFDVFLRRYKKEVQRSGSPSWPRQKCRICQCGHDDKQVE